MVMYIGPKHNPISDTWTVRVSGKVEDFATREEALAWAQACKKAGRILPR